MSGSIFKSRIFNAKEIEIEVAATCRWDGSNNLLGSRCFDDLVQEWGVLNNEFYKILPDCLKAKLIKSSSTPIPKSKVSCVIPYLDNHCYLNDALLGIASQTHKPDMVIIAIDNCTEIVYEKVKFILGMLGGIRKKKIIKFKGFNGPYKMLNQIYDEHVDDGLLWLHDSDDISHPNRLELQLGFMNTHRLDICSSFEISILNKMTRYIQYPLNATRSLLSEPGHCMLWPGSLIKKTLWDSLRGCSDKHKFGADTEFQLRACFISRMGNYPAFLYARRKRSNSLTGSKETGHGSWCREYLNSLYKADYYFRQMQKSKGLDIDLKPRFSSGSIL